MAIVDLPNRVCPHCGGTRWSMEPKKTGFVRYRCPVLAQERRKRWKAKNPERVLQHEKTHAEKRVAVGYFKKRRQLIKEQSIINQQLNSKNMATNSYFYNWRDIQRMKELIRTGQPLMQIARNEYANFGATEKAFYTKLTKVAKSTNKIRTWEGPKKIRTKRTENPVPESVTSGISVPEGTTFEGTPKKVVIYSNHFRIYF